MKALIKFAGIKDVKALIQNEANLPNALYERIQSMQLGGLEEYLTVLIDNPNFNKVPVEYETVKYLNQGDTITFSNFAVDWYNDKYEPLANWFQILPDNLNFYTLDLLCEVSTKGIIGNYFVLSLSVLDVGYIVSVK
jgi:hypothetical protein